MDYDTWKFSKCELDYDSTCECRQCEKNASNLEAASFYLEKVLKQLYSKSSLNKCDLENDLDQLCYALSVKTNQEDIQIERPEQVTLKNFIFNSINDLNRVT